MAIEVRPCASHEELAGAQAAIGHYFGHEPTVEDAERFAQWIELERMHAAWADGRIVGGAGAFTYDVSVPGGARVPCAGVTVIGVLPTHRRRGVLKAMMRAQLDDVHSRGEQLAYLWASEATIYGRYGYGLASRIGGIELPRDRTEFAQPTVLRGLLRTVDLGEALAAFPPLYERMRDARPGMFSRDRAWWETRRLADDAARRRPGIGPLQRILLELDGQPAGYALYRIEPGPFRGGVTGNSVNVIEVVSASAEAERELWRFLLDIDWVATIKADLLPLDHPLFLLLAEPRRLGFTVNDGVWVRLVDVQAALGARALNDGQPVVIEVEDLFCDWNAGRWSIAAGEVARTDEEADLRLDVTGLGSVYLGGFGFGDLVRAGRAEELRAGAADRADSLFNTGIEPWCAEIF